MGTFGLLLIGVLAFLAPKAGWHSAGWVMTWLREREDRIAFTWRRRIDRGVEDIRQMYQDRKDDELRRKAAAAYQLDRSLYVEHGRRREPTPDLLAELHRRQEAARRVAPYKPLTGKVELGPIQ